MTGKQAEELATLMTAVMGFTLGQAPQYDRKVITMALVAVGAALRRAMATDMNARERHELEVVETIGGQIGIIPGEVSTLHSLAAQLVQLVED